MNESELVGLAKQADNLAWEALMREHQQAVFRLAYLLVGNSGDAEDVAQEAFIRAFYALNSFDQSRNLRPWLLCITRNVAYNWRRSLRRYVAAVERMTRATDEPVTYLEERSSQDWEARTLWQAVQRMKGPEREVIYLRYFLDLSEAEMATALAVAPGTVKSRLHRAILKLRTLVDLEFPTLRTERQT